MVSLHERAKDVFLAALDRPVDERRAYIQEACGSDAALFREVESLLKFHEQTGSTNVSDTTTGHPDGGSHDAAADAFNPGDVFAGRYRMVTRIGRGGMGDVWRADDLVLETPVALKLITSTGPAARARRSSTKSGWPGRSRTRRSAACSTSAKTDGIVFFSMELVQRRGPCDAAAPRRPPAVREVCSISAPVVRRPGGRARAGRAAPRPEAGQHPDRQRRPRAHHRLRHRDPARGRTARTLTGTPGVHGARTADAGRHAVRAHRHLRARADPLRAAGRTASVRQSAQPHRRPADAVLARHERRSRARAGGSAGADGRSDRSAAVGARTWCASSTIRSRGERPHAGRAGDGPGGRRWAPSLVGVLVVAAHHHAARAARDGGTLSEQDTIVLADFANTTGDPVFDGTLKVALAVALEQSPFLKVFPDDRMRETLRLMERRPMREITRAVAREIAQREQLKALLAGSIASARAQLRARARSHQRRDRRRHGARAGRGRQQGASAERRSAAPRRGCASKLGESLASIQKFDVPLRARDDPVARRAARLLARARSRPA